MNEKATAEKIDEAIRLFRNAERIMTFTGAGISTESGLSDFRSPGGLWSRYRMVTYQEFLESAKGRREYWAMRRELIPELLRARPNKAHKALAELEKIGKMEAVITQNIDGLHQDAGSSRVLELHGTNRTASCLGCGRQWPIEPIQQQLEEGNLDPRCDSCAGLIKPDTVSFGQAMPQDVMAEAFSLAETCDLLLMIGSSLEVHPAASIPPAAHQYGARLIFINRTRTPLDHLADILFRESAGEILEAIVNGLQNDCA
ncbi:MAG: Sir2 family NAD-dependent protein deacetylase [Deltaproteobacteria bacterium]|nr:Sir2 family NAD-dependent protein deacetylase [Deltaproteobacteria bacterium]